MTRRPVYSAPQNGLVFVLAVRPEPALGLPVAAATVAADAGIRPRIRDARPGSREATDRSHAGDPSRARTCSGTARLFASEASGS